MTMMTTMTVNQSKVGLSLSLTHLQAELGTLGAGRKVMTSVVVVSVADIPFEEKDLRRGRPAGATNAEDRVSAPVKTSDMSWNIGHDLFTVLVVVGVVVVVLQLLFYYTE
jgi:hypothetical protein